MKVPSSLDVVEQLMSEIAIDRSLRWLIVPRSETRLNACADSLEWDDETPGCDRTSLEMLMTPCVANEEETAQMEEERQCVESCCVVNHKSSARRLINRASQRVSRWKEMRLSVCSECTHGERKMDHNGNIFIRQRLRHITDYRNVDSTQDNDTVYWNLNWNTQ